MPRSRYLLPTLALLGIAAGIHAPVAPASTSQDAIFQDDGQLRANPLGTLQTLRGLGVTRVRVGVYWGKIAPNGTSRRRPSNFNATDPAAYRGNWAQYDEIVKDARAEGISVYFLLTGPAPIWATGPGAPAGGPYGQWKPSAREFGAFVSAAAKRYSGSYYGLPRVSFWSIWNEPNYGIDLAPQATNHDTVEVGASAYRGLVDTAYSALTHGGHARDTILIGETAPHGLNHPIGNFSGVKPLRFLRALYCVDTSYRPLLGAAAAARGCPTTAVASTRFRALHPGLFAASGFAGHLYAQGLAPNRSLANDPDYADLASVPRLERTLDRLQGVYGSHNQLPIWNTEYGYWTNPPAKVAKISPTTAAYYINWAEYLSWQQPRIRSYMQYLLVDPPLDNFASGLVFKTGALKQPVYDAYRMPLFLPNTAGRSGRSLELWGSVRPAQFAAAGQQALIQFQRHGQRSWQTLRSVPITNLRGYFDLRQTFPISGSVRVAWAEPGAGTVYSRSVAIKLS